MALIESLTAALKVGLTAALTTWPFTTATGQVVAAYVFDSFNRTNSTTGLGIGDTGETWSALEGVYGIKLGPGAGVAYLVTDAANNRNTTVLPTSYSDGRVCARMALQDAGGGGGVVARCSDYLNYILANGGSTTALYAYVAGVYTSLGSGTVSGTGDRLFLVLNGTSLAMWRTVSGLAPELLVSATSSHNVAQTKHGIYRNLLSNPSEFDNFCVTPVTTLAFASGKSSDNTGLIPATADSGHALTKLEAAASTWGYVAGSFYLSTSAGYSWLTMLGAANGCVEADITVNGITSMGLGCRFITQADGMLTDYDAVKYALYKRVASSFSLIGSAAVGPAAGKQRFAFNGSTYTISMDGVVIGTFTDASNTTGTNHGMSSSVNTQRYKNIVIT